MARFLSYIVIGFIVFCSVALAQDDNEQSRLIQFVESRLSTENRQIRLNGIQGTLSSNVSFDSITIADNEGIWLTISEPQLVWNRTALLRGRLDIESLTASSIDMPRGPIADDSVPSPEAGGITVPELPVAVILEELNVPTARFGQTVFGLETEISIAGNLTLDSGSLDTELDIVRLDGPGGALTLDINYDGSDETIVLDINLEEPENGIIANLTNLEGKPPVALSVTGDAPINELEVALSFDVDSRQILDGNLKLNGNENGLNILADLGGPLSSILPAQYEELLGAESVLRLNALRSNEGAFEVKRLMLESGLIAINSNLNILSDGFLSALNLDARIVDPTGDQIVLPGTENSTSIANAEFSIAYDAADTGAFQQQFLIADLNNAEFAIANIAVNTDGSIANFADPAARAISFITTGGLTGIAPSDPDVATAVGDAITIDGSGNWRSGEALNFDKLDVTGATYAVQTNGALQGGSFTGQIGVEAADLNSFSALADRVLSGSLGLVANGEIKLLSRAFDLQITGVGNGLQTDIETLDKLLTGTSNLSGSVKRDADGLSFDRFRILNNQADILLNGRYATDFADLVASADLRNIGDISEAGNGAISVQVSIQGEAQPYAAQVAVEMPSGALSGKSVQGLALGFDGTLGAEIVQGSLSGSGTIDSQPVTLAGKVKRDDIELALSEIDAQIGAASIQASVVRKTASGFFDGDVLIDADDISSIAALALQDASGGLNATINLSHDGETQAANIDATANDLRYQENRIGSADMQAQIDALLSAPQIDADVSASDLSVGGTQIRSIDGNVETDGANTAFDIVALMAQENARIETRGNFVQSSGRQSIDLQTLSLESDIGDANLLAPANITISNGTTTLSTTRLNVAGGQVTVAGSINQNINITADIAQLPLNIANAFSPNLGLGGTVNGQIRTSGSLGAPRADFNITGNGVTAQQLAEAQISPLSLTSSGAADLSAQRISLSSLNVSNAQSIQINGSGTIPFSGAGLNFNADGTAPLDIAERFLANRGATISGTARFNVTATGSTAAPQLNGLVSVASGTLTDPLSNLRLTDIGLIAGLNGDQINIQRLNAQLSGGGSISGSGSVGITGDFPANISIQLNNAGYSDGQTFSTTVNGQLSVTGALARDPLLSGNIDVGETEIAVPESFTTSSDLLEVKHIAPTPRIQRTLDRVAKASPLPAPSARPSILQLDLNISAPNRIFVRGRGLDAELGGTILLRGPVTNLAPSGRFELIRGRLNLLGQRFDLDEGSVTLTGSLDPLLNFTVSTISGDVTAFIFITGRASDIQVSFGSDPELPEDEVLAQIIFGQSIADLSPTQIARLASIAIELTGGNSPGLVDGIRDGLGLDDLDIVQDSDGNAAVRVGKYISDNVYLGVQAGQETEATINLDITDSLTARGAVSSDGDTSLGVFFEKDY